MVYYVLDVQQGLKGAFAGIEKLASSSDRLREALVDVSAKTDHVKSLVGQLKSSMPPKTVVVNKDGCVPAECLARVLLKVWELRRSFALGAMSSDSVRAIKPLLEELHDEEIDESLRVLERFTHKKGYRELKEELHALKKTLHFGKKGPLLQYVSRWVTVENRNDKVWQDFANLENLVDTGAWYDALEFVEDSTLRSVPRLKLWARDLEFILSVEGHITLICNKLIERVNRNPEGI
ncbi:hypothetical protein [Candidatus Anaplasma sp. TIGMIC]|uniref:hypothetical protein n=1 Tax=Candidatus Anaplasma sp. TIGMIC TaxID=3020713 RepID=UPI00232D78A1|nr:hypothetical protein [Candidatus Anaplasma sp. TIGMIC]MDB1135627.1 hypothetical protein [Candidatus Anaplasma sp. TIGMIC]